MASGGGFLKAAIADDRRGRTSDMKAASAGVSGSHAALALTFFSSTSTIGSMRVAYLLAKIACRCSAPSRHFVSPAELDAGADSALESLIGSFSFAFLAMMARFCSMPPLLRFWPLPSLAPSTPPLSPPGTPTPTAPPATRSASARSVTQRRATSTSSSHRRACQRSSHVTVSLSASVISLRTSAISRGRPASNPCSSACSSGRSGAPLCSAICASAKAVYSTAKGAAAPTSCSSCSTNRRTPGWGWCSCANS
mmetsp:Transcript_11830/g.32315  ORF Transcript_11830/g.32315 Transcript_11830/m.32315 type:complete len:253 (+) Transcript_11830:780-1538(+)